MKTKFTNDEFRKIIDNDIYTAYIGTLTYNCYTDYEDVEGNSCLAFVGEFDVDNDEIIFPWDDIKEITFSPIFRMFTIFMKDGSYRDEIRLLTTYIPQ